MRTRVLLCDDHTLFREGIRAMLGEDPTLEIVGQAQTGNEAVEQAARLRPDVVLLDVGLPDLMGYEAARRIRKEAPSARIIILTMYEEEDIVNRCLDVGAAGYVLKASPAAQLLEAIHTVRRGGKYLSPKVLDKVMDQYVRPADRSRDSYDLLSSREREILKLLAEGLSVKEVAQRLDLSVKTADVHKYNLMRKLKIHSRTELVKYAVQRNLIEVRHLQQHPTKPAKRAS